MNAALRRRARFHDLLAGPQFHPGPAGRGRGFAGSRIRSDPSHPEAVIESNRHVDVLRAHRTVVFDPLIERLEHPNG